MRGKQLDRLIDILDRMDKHIDDVQWRLRAINHQLVNCDERLNQYLDKGKTEDKIKAMNED